MIKSNFFFRAEFLDFLRNIFSRLIFLLLIFSLGCDKNPADHGGKKRWVEQDLGDFGKGIGGIIIGDGDWDGAQEIYCTTSNKYICQLKKSAAGWVISDIASFAMETSNLIIGDGDGCGKNEIYFYSREKIFQCKWNGTAWNTNEIENAGYMKWYDAIDIGDCDRDGVQELYGTCGNHYIYQFRCINSQWTKILVDSSNSGWNNLAIGDGNNDGALKLYSIEDHNLFQLKRAGANWQKSKVMLTNCYYYIVIGDGDGDGRNEIYCDDANGFGDVYISQFKWNGYNWSVSQFGKITYYNHYGPIVIGDADNDGINEVYAGLAGELYQFKGQNKTRIKSGSGCVIGDGDNNGLNEIYSTRADYHLYQYSWQ